MTDSLEQIDSNFRWFNDSGASEFTCFERIEFLREVSPALFGRTGYVKVERACQSVDVLGGSGHWSLNFWAGFSDK
ncbi:MAG: hypothetical protein HWN69_00010 [Desulfobacterales bacterium]|nr:hypothetical protein [Desulfobacterales bacterium]